MPKSDIAKRLYTEIYLKLLQNPEYMASLHQKYVSAKQYVLHALKIKWINSL